MMRIKSLIFCISGAILVGTFQILEARPAHAQTCTFSKVAMAFEAGVRSIKAGKYPDALTRLRPLAQAGFGPAQRELAKMYGSGQGVSKSPQNAALWSELAFRSGDKDSRKLSHELRSALNKEGRRQVSIAAGDWNARSASCSGSGVKASANGFATESPLVISIGFDKRVKPEVRQTLEVKVQNLVKRALKSEQPARIYLRMIDEIEIYDGNRYHRYLGWKQGKKGNILRFASSNLEDLKPDFMAEAMVVEAKRRAYALLPGADFVDPMERNIGGIKVFGSSYPDVRNDQFFSVIRQALEMAKRLPKSLQKYIEIIDEVHYNPISKHFVREGALDATGAYYNKLISVEGHRLMFVRRDVRYSSPLFFLQIFIHEGTHAVQDQQAFRNLKYISRIKKRLAYMQQTGHGNTKRFAALKKEIDVKMDYAKRWYQGIKMPKGRIQDITFECEATRNEISAIKALDGPPDVMKTSGYLKLCPEAQRMIIQWKDEKLRSER